MLCPNENALIDFVEMRLSSVQRLQVEEHLDICEDCRELVARTAESLIPDTEPAFRGEHHALVPGMLVGRYVIERPIGAGGMGVVYAAADPELRRKVALKVLRWDASQGKQMRARMMREARATSAIRHPNVLPIHDIQFLADGSPVLVMDLLEGESLRGRLEREKVLCLSTVAKIMVQVLSALEATHAVGVIHRDIKPDNLFLCRSADGSDGEVKVLDFGVAKLTAQGGSLLSSTQSALTHTGAMLGTPYYMAPEQAFGEKDLDGRVDLWSVGLILYECLTGILPTEGANLGHILKTLTDLSIPPCADLVPGLPSEITKLVDSLLRSKEDRPKTAGAIKKVLVKYLNGPDLSDSQLNDLKERAALRRSGQASVSRKGWARSARSGQLPKRSMFALIAGVTLVAGLVGATVATSVARNRHASTPDAVSSDANALVFPAALPSEPLPDEQVVVPGSASSPPVVPSFSARPKKPESHVSVPASASVASPPVPGPGKLMTTPLF